MITGIISANLEAVILLVVVGPNRQQLTVSGVLDTGFSGDLTLPASVNASLGLAWLGREPGILADGSTDLFDVYQPLFSGMVSPAPSKSRPRTRSRWSA